MENSKRILNLTIIMSVLQIHNTVDHADKLFCNVRRQETDHILRILCWGSLLHCKFHPSNYDLADMQKLKNDGVDFILMFVFPFSNRIYLFILNIVNINAVASKNFFVFGLKVSPYYFPSGASTHQIFFWRIDRESFFLNMIPQNIDQYRLPDILYDFCCIFSVK